MKKFDIVCEKCGTKVGEAEFPDEQPDADCIFRCSHGYQCETCVNIPPEEENVA